MSIEKFDSFNRLKTIKVELSEDIVSTIYFNKLEIENDYSNVKLETTKDFIWTFKPEDESFDDYKMLLSDRPSVLTKEVDIFEKDDKICFINNINWETYEKVVSGIITCKKSTRVFFESGYGAFEIDNGKVLILSGESFLASESETEEINIKFSTDFKMIIIDEN